MTVSQIQALCTSTKVKTSVEKQPMCAETLQDLLEAALNLARVDESINDANASAPPAQDADAQKWHDVSLRALTWTRCALASKQETVLNQLLQHAKLRCQSSAPVSTLGEIQSQTKTAATRLSSPLSSDAAPFCPGPPGVWILPSPEARASLKLMAEGDPGTQHIVPAFDDVGIQGSGSLREDLMRLREYDPDRCLIVRRIKRLGVESADRLREYFGRFGNVSEVLVAHSFEKRSIKCRCDRLRPAALGFIVMESVEAAREAISAGPTLEVGKVQINVKKFEAFEDESDHEESAK